jgi:hypothetical protein
VFGDRGGVLTAGSAAAKRDGDLPARFLAPRLSAGAPRPTGGTGAACLACGRIHRRREDEAGGVDHILGDQVERSGLVIPSGSCGTHL